MTEMELNQFRKRLTSLARRVKQDTESVTELTRGGSGGQAIGELSNAPMHLGDMGTEEYLQDLNATLLENGEYLANEAISALKRIDNGTFGSCEECGDEIARERLVALPATRYCIRCAETQQSSTRVNMNAGRPQGPRDTLAPEGEMGEGRRRRQRLPANDDQTTTVPSYDTDVHATGTAGGGTALGGLAGTNAGHGDPDAGALEDAMGSGHFDVNDARDRA